MLQNFLDHFRERKSATSEEHRGDLKRAITQLREVLGAAGYESLARRGEAMTTAATATYAYDQIDQARAELERS